MGRFTCGRMLLLLLLLVFWFSAMKGRSKCALVKISGERNKIVKDNGISQPMNGTNIDIDIDV